MIGEMMAPKNTPGTDLDPVTPDPFKQAAGVAKITDPKDAANAIVQRILAAETLEDVFRLQGTLSADDIQDRVFDLIGVQFRDSDYEDGVGVYAFISALFHDTGEVAPITCGGSNVCAQLLKASQIIGFQEDGETLTQPYPGLKLVKADKPTKRGYYPLWLTLADAA